MENILGRFIFVVFLIHTLTHYRMTHDGGRGLDRNLSLAFVYFCPHDLRHETSLGFRCLILDLTGGMSIGMEGEACIVMAQHAVDGFGINAIPEDYCGESVPLWHSKCTLRAEWPGSDGGRLVN